MKNYIRCALCTLFVWLLAQPFYAQTQDTETGYTSDESTQTTGAVWTELGATKVLPYNLSLGLDVGFRSNDWFNEASRWDIGLGLSWKPTKHWKFGVGYTFLMKYYPQETAHKNVKEIEWKYRANGAPENTDFPEFMGPKYPENPDADVVYTYKGYNEIEKNYTRTTESYWRAKHRISFDATYTYKFWKWLRVSLRERYQLTFVPQKEVNRTRTGTKTVCKYREPNYDGENEVTSYDEITYYYQEGNTIYALDKTDDNAQPEDVTTAYLAEHDNIYLNDPESTVKEKGSKTLHVLRSRLTFEVDKKGWQWTPFAYVESFNNIGESWHTDKFRVSAGVDYSLSGGHKLSLGYVFNHENDDDGDLNIHAICVGYKFKF